MTPPALSLSHEFATLLELSPSLVRSLNGTIRSWNSGCRRLYGWPAEIALGRISHELFQTKFPKPLAEINDELLATGNWSGELQHVRSDGSRLDVLTNWALSRDGKGQSGLAIIETNQDITALKTTQAELAEAKLECDTRLSELETLYRSAPIGLAFLDAELRYQRVNETLARMHGLPIEDHIGKRPHDILPELQKAAPLLLQVLVTSQPVKTELVASTPATRDALRHFQMTLYPVSHGKLKGVGAVVEDVTDRHAGAAARRLLGSIVESSGDAIISKDLNGIITSWNRGAERIFGYTAEEAIGQPLTLIVPQDRVREFESTLAKLNAGESIGPIETIRRRKDGKNIHVSVTVSLIFDSNGHVVGASKTSRDITEQKRAEQLLRATNDQLQQFAYAAAHDLQEPLRTARLFADMLKMRYSEQVDEPGREYIGLISRSAERMQELVSDLLAYAKTANAQRTQNVNTLDSCQTAVRNLATAIAESGAQFEFGSLPNIQADPVHMVQLFQNLIANALKYRAASRRPLIRVYAEPRDHEWIFAVQDNGIGIAPEHFERIFRVFKRLHGNEVPGNGIGLAICQKIVDAYQGRIWLESELGRGSTFFFSIPLKVEEAL